MDLQQVKRNWEEFGRLDPLWSILVVDGKKGRKWDIEDFFATGIQEVSNMMNRISALDLPARHRRALDFGCGVGRLTQPLGSYFEEVYGVDIASSMIQLATSLNRHSNCKFYLNERSDLSSFPDGYFDLVCSLITLQHLEPKDSKDYLSELVRVLSPKGVLYFQIPDHKLPDRQAHATLSGKLKSEAYARLKRHRRSYRLYRNLRPVPAKPSGPVMQMRGIARDEVVELIRKSGGEVVSVEVFPDAHDWLSYRYCVTK